jgi:hypothetical protein
VAVTAGTNESFTLRESGDGIVYTEDVIQTSAGTTAAKFSHNVGTIDAITAVVTLKAASGGAETFGFRRRIQP